MKRLLTFLALSLFFFNCIGYQLYNFAIETNDGQNSSTAINLNGAPERAINSGKTTASPFSFFAKDIDSDDLLEFTSGENYAANEIFLTFSSDIFPEHADKENHSTSPKYFNSEYYSSLDNHFIKYPDVYSFSKIPDRYLLSIPVIFLSPKDHPPQHIS